MHLYEMANLPNKKGYRFIGVDNTSNKHECEVRVNSVGMHEVYRVDNNEPYWCNLIGWLPLKTSATPQGNEN